MRTSWEDSPNMVYLVLLSDTARLLPREIDSNTKIAAFINIKKKPLKFNYATLYTYHQEMSE